MTPEERSLIEGLFRRLNETAKALPAEQIDPEADRAIRGAVAAQPIAPYLLVQNALVMENAKQAAQARIAELEAAQAAPPPRSFLSGASPWTRRETPAAAPPPAYPQQGYPQPGYPQPAYGQPAPAYAPPPGQPSFMRSALTTAAGVAGGALLFQGISSLMSSHGGGSLGSLAQQGMQTPQTVVNETVNNYFPAPSAQDVAYNAPQEDRGYTPASYDAPSDSGWGGDEDV